MTLSGRLVASPISVTDSALVLELRIAWPGVTSSSSANTACLMFMRSGTASITKSTSPKPSYSVVPWMRPTSACACSSACSWVSFSFLTRRPNWACVTCVAFSRPWSTNFWSTSFSTTSTSAAASTWAISPPIVPAPTTAALNTNMAGETLRSLWRGGTADWPRGAPGRLQRGFLGRLGGEPLERAGERVGLRAADEDEVDEVAQRVPALELVVERQRERGGVVVVRCGGELGRLGADQLLLEHL